VPEQQDLEGLVLFAADEDLDEVEGVAVDHP
jgi:hypothetical protein